MSIYCVYITFYRGNKLPPFYIGKTSVDKIQNGYNGSVSSKLYKGIWENERKINPQLFKTIILKTFIDKRDSSTYEEYLQRFFNAHRNPMFINKNIGGKTFNLDEQFQNKTHHFYDSDKQTKLNTDRINNGSHQFLDSLFQSEMSSRAKAKPGWKDNQSRVTKKTNANTIAAGTHNFLGKGEEFKKLIQEKKSRTNAKKLKELVIMYSLKLGQNWYRKTDTWIDNKIIEVLTTYQPTIIPQS